MPTRVVLRDSAASTGAGRRRAVRRETVDDFAMRPTLTPPSRISTTSPNARPSVQRSISVNFRTALRDDDEESETFREAGGALTDIRGSPRLMGYLSCGLASAVNLVSVMQFWAKEGDANVTVFRRLQNATTDVVIKDDDEEDAVFRTTVLEPKLIGAVAVASAGVFFSILVRPGKTTSSFCRLYTNCYSYHVPDPVDAL